MSRNENSGFFYASGEGIECKELLRQRMASIKRAAGFAFHLFREMT